MDYDQELQKWNRRVKQLRKRMEVKSLKHVVPDTTIPPGRGKMTNVLLENAEELHRQYPEIFHFLDWPELEPGDTAEVSVLLVENNSDGNVQTGSVSDEVRISSERFWVEIESVDSDVLTGRIANDILRSDKIHFNDRIQLHRSHIHSLLRREDVEKLANKEPAEDNDLRLRAAKLLQAAVTCYCTESNDIEMLEKLRAEGKEYQTEIYKITIGIDERILSERRARHRFARSLSLN